MTEETQEPVSVIEQAAPSVEQSVIMETPVPEPSTSTPTLTPTPETPVDLGAKLLDSETTPAPSEPLPDPLVAPAPVILPQPVVADRRSLLRKALEKIQFRKRAKLEKIIKFAQEKGSITNDQVEKLLHVSDATAGRYLKALVQQNRLKVIGDGNSRRYESS